MSLVQTDILDKIKVFRRYPSYEKLSILLLLTKSGLDKNIHYSDTETIITHLLSKLEDLDTTSDHASSAIPCFVKTKKESKILLDQLLRKNLLPEYTHLYKYLTTKKSIISSNKTKKEDLEEDLDEDPASDDVSEDLSDDDTISEPIEKEIIPEVEILEIPDDISEEYNDDEEDEYSD